MNSAEQPESEGGLDFGGGEAAEKHKEADEDEDEEQPQGLSNYDEWNHHDPTAGLWRRMAWILVRANNEEGRSQRANV